MRLKLILSIFSGLLCLLVLNCDSNPYQQGKILYSNFCESCHMTDGSGLAGNIPPLVNADYLKNNQDKLACIIRYGQQGPIVVNDTTYNEAMPGVPQLTDFEIANVINYINHAWGNDYGFIQIDEVRESLKECEKTMQ